MMKGTWVIALFFAAVWNHSFGQGCSDPGLCTIGSLNSEITKDTVSGVDFTEADLDQLLAVQYTREKFRFEVSEFYSIGMGNTQILQTAATFAVRLKKKNLLNIKVPFTYVFGKLGSNAGLGDITLSYQNTFYSTANTRLSATVGVVAPTGNANASSGGFALPMVYQTTLGCFNVLAGFSGAYKKWGAVLGYQYSIGQNKNEFYTEDLVLNDTVPGYDELNADRTVFGSARHLQRGSDLMLRLERRFDIGKKVGLSLGVLPIVRLTASRYTLPTGETITKAGSDGLTLNITGGAKYTPSKYWLFRFNFGAPVITRKSTSDGLKRAFVGILSAAYRLW